MPHNTPSRCSPCYTATAAECTGQLTLAVQLNPNEAYWCRLTDKFGNRLLQQVQTDEEGSFTLNLETLGKGRFLASSGTYLIEVLQHSNSCNPLLLNFCGQGLSCLNLSFIKVDGDEITEPQVIPCPCNEG